MPITSRPRRALLPAALFLSGFAALAVEVLAQRMLVHVLGCTTIATTAVLAAYMGGLALGAGIAGRHGDKLSPRRSLAWYLRLEIIVGATAAVVALCLTSLSGWITGAVAALPEGAPRFLGRFLLGALLLLLPTTAMGATLPLAVRAQIGGSRPDLLGGTGTLYAMNTAGAMAGALLAPLCLLPAFGLRNAVIVAACGSWLAAAVARAAAVAPAETTMEAQPEDPSSSIPFWWVGLAAFSSGAVALGFEIVWTRALTTLAGSTVYAFAFVLATVLGGLALGSAMVGALGKRVERSAFACGVAAVLGPGLSVVLMPLLDLVPARMAGLATAGELSLVSSLTLVLTVGAAVILPPTICFGAALPLAVRAVRTTDNAKAVGRTYVANTIGALGGAMAMGLWLLPAVGNAKATTVYALFGCVGASALLIRSTTRDRRLRSLAITLVLVVAAGAVVSPKPSFYAGASAAHFPRPRVARRLYYGEGREASVLVEAVGVQRVFYVASRPEASDAWSDLRNQYLLGHLPALFAARVRSSFVIGLGSGMTAGVLTLHGEVTVAELNEAVLPATRLFRDLNHDVIARARITIEDGRILLAKGDRKYDVVTTDPIHPYVAGSAALYTYEHLQLCRRRLAPGGAVSLWVPLDQMGPQELRGILGSFVDVFPDAELFLNRSNAVLVGGGRPRRSDTERLSLLKAGWSGQVASDMRLARVASPEELLASRVAGPEQLRRFARGVRRVHDDDHWIELTLPGYIYRGTAAANTRDLIALRDRSERARPLVRAFDAVQFAYHLLSAGRFSDAFRLLRATLDRGESPLLEHSIMLRDTSAQLALVLLRSGRRREALALARAELERPDATINSLLKLGPVFKAVGDRSSIDRRDARLIQGWPRRPDARLECGRTQLQRGHFARAIPLLKKALALDHFEGLAWHTLGLLGRAHLGAGQIAEGRAALQRSLALNPKQPTIAALLRRSRNP